MTTARWISLIIGCLCIGSIHIETKDTNIWDFLCNLVLLAVPCSLVIVPLILEYLERR